MMLFYPPPSFLFGQVISWPGVPADHRLL